MTALRTTSLLRAVRAGLLGGAAALTLSACAIDPLTTSSIGPSVGPTPDFSSLNRADAQANLQQLASAYEAHPKDKATIIFYAAALRAEGQADQSIAVLEQGMAAHPKDPEIRVAYAKALTAGGRFEQALAVLDDTIRPDAPDWNALSVKGAIYDQMGRNQEARELYTQALLIAPGEASLEANMGLSYAMTSDLNAAEQHLRRAVKMKGATSQIRQNLALVVGLQGRFDEARDLFARELAPDQVEANMAYIRALLTQQNRWDLIAQGDAG
jgi:Flp pilus assembly protein TadD